MICLTCNQPQTVTVRPAKPFSRIVTTQCGCGYHVGIVSVIDPEKFASHSPLPGYDRDSIADRLKSFAVVTSSDSGYVHPSGSIQ